jgi:hypothetical protein
VERVWNFRGTVTFLRENLNLIETDMKKLSCLLLFCCAPLVLHGCGPANPFGTVVVSGKVTVDGAPMEGITISFSPNGGEGMAAFGMTDASGNYKLTTGGAPFGTGAKPGSYDVAFSKVSSGPGRSMADFSAGVPLQPGGPPQATHLIPEKFADAKTAGFDPVEVKKGKKNNFEFNLETK